MIVRVLLICGLLAAILAQPVRAQSLEANGFVDLRLVSPSDQRSWLNGGLGKLRFEGPGRQGINPEVGEAVLDLRAEVTESLSGLASLRYAPDQKTALDVLETYARYQPVTTGSWRWSVKLGAFFPPISLENESVGWTSPRTLTPSAINSWVGDELRTFGGEIRVSDRLGPGVLELTGAVFGWNDPAGQLLAYRGWALNDRPLGFLDSTRLPDIVARQSGDDTPYRTQLFRDVDNQAGWYGEASWRQDGLGRASFLYYDNRADPAADQDDVYAWHTRFASLGLEIDIDDLVLLSQAMAGSTESQFFDDDYSTTDFQSAYVLAGEYFGDWRAAARFDVFATQQPSEHGYALTGALTWTPLHWLRVTAEAVQLASYRPQRELDGKAAQADETQIQLGLRFSY